MQQGGRNIGLIIHYPVASSLGFGLLKKLYKLMMMIFDAIAQLTKFVVILREHFRHNRVPQLFFKI